MAKLIGSLIAWAIVASLEFAFFVFQVWLALIVLGVK